MGRNDNGELAVLQLLQTWKPDEFAGLAHADSPDLQDAKRELGIEVTVALYGKHSVIAQRDSLWRKYRNRNISDIPPRDAERIRSERIGMSPCFLDGKLASYIRATYWEGEAHDALLEAVKRKTSKLRGGHYARWQDIRLFVRCPLSSSDNEGIMQAIRDGVAWSEGCAGPLYSHIYAEFDDYLFDYDCRQDEFEAVPHPMLQKCKHF